MERKSTMAAKIKQIPRLETSESGSAEAGPSDLRFIRVEVATKAALPHPEDQQNWCGCFPPAALNIRIVVGTDAWEIDPVEFTQRAAAAATEPLKALLAEMQQGEAFQQTAKLAVALATAETKAAEALTAASEALEQARQALSQGRDPEAAEQQYRRHTADAEVYRNRATQLRQLHAQAAATAQDAALQAIEQRRIELLAEATRRDQEINAAIVSALAPLLPQLLAVKSAKMQLADDRHRDINDSSLAAQIRAGMSGRRGVRLGV
jgi:hypothetical protein